jgi:phage terminase large subunit
VDRSFRTGEDPAEYNFIPALVFDNPALTQADPEYVRSLESLPPRLKDAWLYGRWDVFEGQFFPEFDTQVHLCAPSVIPRELNRYIALDYGLDRLAALLLGVDSQGNLWVIREYCRSGLTLSEAAGRVAALAAGENVQMAVCSPDLWNRRQDSGKSGFEIMQSVSGMPPMSAADDRRIPGWRVLREYLAAREGHPFIRISSECKELAECLPALLCDPMRGEDASSSPHAITHAPEALRYAVMSRVPSLSEAVREVSPLTDFKMPTRSAPVY